jgi:heptosyltransferase III
LALIGSFLMQPSELRRIAVFRNDRLGDLVCTLPLFEALRSSFSQAQLTAIVSPESAPLVANHPDVDRVLTAEKRTPVSELTKLLRAGQFDAILLVRCSGKNALAARLARIPIRVAHGRQWFHALCGTHRFYKARRNPPLHEADYSLSFAERLGIQLTVDQAHPRLVVNPAERTAIAERLTSQIGNDGPLFAVHPCNRGSAYNWPRENYLETINRLAIRGRVVITGSRYDQANINWLTTHLEPALRNRVTTLTDLKLPQLVAALSLVDAFLASSTGPLHIAAIVSRAAVGLFCDVGYQHPNRWQPIGRQSIVLMAQSDAQEPPPIGSPESESIMARISVDTVVEQMCQAAERAYAA